MDSRLGTQHRSYESGRSRDTHTWCIYIASYTEPALHVHAQQER